MALMKKDKSRIMIVDDDRAFVDSLTELLTALGYVVCAAVSTGDEAMAAAGAHRPDIVLMDIRLRGPVDGIETAEQIRTVHDIPVVYVTAHADDDLLDRIKETEPFGLLVKPYDEKELHFTVEMALYKHAMERRLRESEQRLHTTLHSIGDAVIATDADGIVTFANPVARHLTGWIDDDPCGRPVSEVLDIADEDTGRTIELPVARIVEEGRADPLRRHSLRTNDGRTIPIEYIVTAITGGGRPTGSVVVFRDITERRLAEEHLQYVAHFDSLTGLPNRMLFFDRLSHGIVQARRYNHLLALLYIDLDAFKRINDTYGHGIGDKLLKEVARRISESVRKADTVARLGGDEFAVILTEITEPRFAAVAARKIIDSISSPITIDESGYTVTTSIGISLYPVNGGNPEALLKSADEAMYAAKREGPNNFLFKGDA